MIKCCPKCRARNVAGGRFYTKQGYYISKHNHQPVPRCRCKSCGANFSAHTFSDSFRQHKPQLNSRLYAVLCSGMTFRRSARVFGVSRNTITSKFNWLAAKARRLHVRALQHHTSSMKTIEFDEMESYQASRLNMLSISMAVQDKTGFILDARVALMRPKGQLAKKYPNAWRRWNQDTRKEASTSVLRRVNRLSGGQATVRCDGKPQYRTLIAANIASPSLELCKRDPSHPEDWKVINYFNHVAAKIRADLARMRRRTWACTRKWQNLQKHLYLYMAWNNRYALSS
jgi:transposase-like protein